MRWALCGAMILGAALSCKALKKNGLQSNLSGMHPDSRVFCDLHPPSTDQNRGAFETGVSLDALDRVHFAIMNNAGERVWVRCRHEDRGDWQEGYVGNIRMIPRGDRSPGGFQVDGVQLKKVDSQVPEYYPTDTLSVRERFLPEIARQSGGEWHLTGFYVKGRPLTLAASATGSETFQVPDLSGTASGYYADKVMYQMQPGEQILCFVMGNQAPIPNIFSMDNIGGWPKKLTKRQQLFFPDWGRDLLKVTCMLPPEAQYAGVETPSQTGWIYFRQLFPLAVGIGPTSRQEQGNGRSLVEIATAGAKAEATISQFGEKDLNRYEVVSFSLGSGVEMVPAPSDYVPSADNPITEFYVGPFPAVDNAFNSQLADYYNPTDRPFARQRPPSPKTTIVRQPRIPVAPPSGGRAPSPKYVAKVTPQPVAKAATTIHNCHPQGVLYTKIAPGKCTSGKKLCLCRLNNGQCSLFYFYQQGKTSMPSSVSRGFDCKLSCAQKVPEGYGCETM